MEILLIFFIIISVIIIFIKKSQNFNTLNTNSESIVHTNIWLKNAINCAELQQQYWRSINKKYTENQYNFISLNLILTRKLLENFNNLSITLEKEDINISYKNYLHSKYMDCDKIYNIYLSKLEIYEKYLKESNERILNNKTTISPEFRLALNFFYSDKAIILEDNTIKETCETLIKILTDNVNKTYLINYKI